MLFKGDKVEFNFKKIYNPIYVFDYLLKKRFIHFFIIGSSGVILNLLITFLLSEFVFLRENIYLGVKGYTISFIFGTACNLIYNFILHTRITFNVKKNHGKRFVIFICYSILMSSFQVWLNKLLVPVFGSEYHIFADAGIILVFSIVTFLLFKLWLFRKD